MNYKKVRCGRKSGALIAVIMLLGVFILAGVSLRAEDDVRTNLIRYYRQVEQWMRSPDYGAVMNNFDKVFEKTSAIAQRCGFEDYGVLSGTETEYEEDEAVLAAYEKMMAVARARRDQENADNKGKVSLHFSAPSNKKFKAIMNRLQESKLLSALADHINTFFYFPEDITISMEECQEENAFYDPEQKKIIICYEMLHYYQKYLAKESDTDGMLEDLTTFDLLHEFGHALIDIYDLPVTGKEEDVADQLATWFILETLDDENSAGLKSVFSAAYWFGYEFDKEEVAVEDMLFWDSHSLDQQRFYNMLCWAYGYQPEIMVEVLGGDLDDVLPEDRRESCEGEYGRMNLSFVRLLYRFMKE